MWKLWKCKVIKIAMRVRMYNVCVKSILLYNIGAQAYTEVQVAKMETAHRKHLRIILGVFYPDTIRNTDLYHQTNARLIREDIIIARWRIFRYALAQDVRDERLPMPCVMRVYFHNHFESYPNKKGAPSTTLPALIHRDLVSVGRKFQTPEDYKVIKGLILDEKEWSQLVANIVFNASTKYFEQAEKAGAKRKRSASDHEHLSEGLQQGSEPVRMRGEDLADSQPTPPHGLGTPSVNNMSDVNNQVDIDLTLPTRRRARKRLPELVPVPDNIPIPKRRKQQASVVAAISENVERNARMVEGLNVYNSVTRGRTF
jgi:hypothetical protein